MRERLRGRAQEGFTLIEVVVTALIVILISVAVAQALMASAHLTGYQRTHSQADQIAQQDQERLRGLSAKQLNDLASPGQAYTVTLDGTTYTVTSTATLESTGGTSSCSSSGTGAIAYYHTTSTVSWTGVNQSTQSAQEESLITPPAGGTLLAQVNDQTGAGLPGVTVKAVGPSDNESGTTDTGGCVYFAGLTAGTFALTFSETGFVDKNGNSSVTSAATVTGTGTALPTSSPIVMGLAGLINASFSTVDNVSGAGGVGGQAAPSLGWFGSGSSSSMTNQGTAVPGSPATSLSATSLFPFYYTSTSNYANNYQVWAGKCLQERPPAGYDMATVNPGSSQSMAVQEPALDVFVTYGGTRVVPAHVKISFGSTSGTSCAESWYATVAANAATSTDGALAYPGQPFASSATSGTTASASGQTGQLTVCADYKSGSTYYYKSLTTNNNNMTAPTSVTVPITSSTGTGLC